jgi:hypothetical protein
MGIVLRSLRRSVRLWLKPPTNPDGDARKLKDWLEMQPQRFVMLRINHDSHNAVLWVTSHFSISHGMWTSGGLIASCRVPFQTFSSLWLPGFVSLLCCPTHVMTLFIPWLDFCKTHWVTPTALCSSPTFYGGLGNLLLRISSALASTVDWRIFSFRLMPSLIVPHKRVTTCLSCSYKIVWMTS